MSNSKPCCPPAPALLTKSGEYPQGPTPPLSCVRRQERHRSRPALRSGGGAQQRAVEELFGLASLSRTSRQGSRLDPVGGPGALALLLIQVPLLHGRIISPKGLFTDFDLENQFTRKLWPRLPSPLLLSSSWLSHQNKLFNHEERDSVGWVSPHRQGQVDSPYPSSPLGWQGLEGGGSSSQC